MTFTASKHADLRVRRLARRGLTLFELLVVLALIVLIAALTAPSFENWFQSYRLQQGIDTVREHWIKARTLAMEEGRPYRFAYELNGRGYRLAPDDFENWPELMGSVAGPRQSGANFAEGLYVEEELPEGVVFYNLEGAMEGRPMLGGWAKESIVFWTDGTAHLAGPDGQERTETQVLLTDRSGRLKGLHVRGMTGVVSVVIVNSVGGP